VAAQKTVANKKSTQATIGHDDVVVDFVKRSTAAQRKPEKVKDPETVASLQALVSGTK
jgi:hypothetical protein